MDGYRENAQLYLASQAIAEAEGLIISDDEVDEELYDVETHGMPHAKQLVMIQERLPEIVYANIVIK